MYTYKYKQHSTSICMCFKQIYKNDKENLKIDNINEYMRSLKHDANIEWNFNIRMQISDFIPDKEIFYEASTYGNLNIKKKK